MNLFLDDLRHPEEVTWVNLPDVKWTLARDYKEFVGIIRDSGIPEVVSFDNDLCDEHYREFYWANSSENHESRGVFRYEKMQLRTGYHCAAWLMLHCMKKRVDFPKYYVHTLNNIAEQDIKNLLAQRRGL